MSDGLLLSDREQEAWELTRTMSRDNAAEEGSNPRYARNVSRPVLLEA